MKDDGTVVEPMITVQKVMERMNHEPGWMVERVIQTRGDT